MRDVGPCLGWAGVREQLKALASRQREGGWTDARGDHEHAGLGGEPGRRLRARRRRGPRSRPPRADALPAYRAAGRRRARRRGARRARRCAYWSPWNEPNHPRVHQPAAGGVRSRGAEPRRPPPTRSSRATLQQALDDAPGRPAARARRDRRAAEVDRATSPRCPSSSPGCRATSSARRRSGPSTPTSAATTRSTPAAAALAAHGCPHPHTIWITETGVGPAPKDLSAGASIADAVAGCRALHDRLVQWYDDPRVTVAFQYTVREDDKFPTGPGQHRPHRPTARRWRNGPRGAASRSTDRAPAHLRTCAT